MQGAHDAFLRACRFAPFGSEVCVGASVLRPPRLVTASIPSLVFFFTTFVSLSAQISSQFFRFLHTIDNLFSVFMYEDVHGIVDGCICR